MYPCDQRVGLFQHRGLLQVGVDGVVDPREDGAVHLQPRRAIIVDHIGEDVIGEGIFAQDDEEEGAPPGVVVGDAIQDDGDEHLDVEDSDGGGVDVGVLGLVFVEGLGAGGGGLPVALLLGLPGGALGRGLHHGWSGGRKPAAGGRIGSRSGWRTDGSVGGGDGSVVAARTRRRDRRPAQMDRSAMRSERTASWRRTCGTLASLGPATEGRHGAGAHVRPASARPSDGEPASVALNVGEAASVVRAGGG